MKTPVLILIAAVMTAGCATDRFALVDQKSGAELGPFLYRTGSYITVGDQTYKLKRLVSRNEYLMDRMKSEIVPEVEFREAHIRDVAEFLGEIAVEDNPAEPFVWIHLLLPNSADTQIPLITYSARYLPLYDVIKSVARLADLDLVVEGGNVWLKYKEN